MNFREIEFGRPSEKNGYNPFSEIREEWGDLLFHGTSEPSAHLIIQNGFCPMGPLKSTSFVRANDVGVALAYACQKRNGARGAVLAVHFHDLNAQGIRAKGPVIHLYNHHLQPKIVAVCYVPISYNHV